MPNPVLSEGKRAPAFTLACHQGDKFRLTSLKGQWVVLYFYPKDMTPGCTTEACDFQDRLGEFEDRGAVVVAMSPDDLDSHERFAQKHGLEFPLLVDRDAKVATKYGVWREKKTAGRRYQGIVRSTFIIDPGGKVARVFDNVRVKGHVAKVLLALDGALNGG